MQIDVSAPIPVAASEANTRWRLEAVICALGFLMVTLDATLVNIALPHAQASLALSNEDRQWLVAAFSLTFGSTLLLGGRIVDYFGAKRMFIVGAVGFASASAVAGLSPNGETLIACRAVQGLFGALLAPASLSITSTIASDPKRRASAFAIYGAVSAAGGPLGMLLGGALNEFASWRWCLGVNLVLAAIVCVAAALWLHRRARGERRSFDVIGAFCITIGLGFIIFGVSRVGASVRPMLEGGLIVAGLLVLGGFVLIEQRVRDPLLPLRLFADRSRSITLLALFLIAGSFMGVAMLMSFFVQEVLGYAPLKAGLALLPSTLGTIVGAAATGALVPRIGARHVFAAGAGSIALGALLLSQAGAHADYLTGVLPGDMLIGLGLGFCMMPASNLILSNVDADDAGVVSALNNSTIQIAASVGATLFNAVFVASSGRNAIEAGASASGYQVAIAAACGCACLALFLIVFVMPAKRTPAE